MNTRPCSLLLRFLPIALLGASLLPSSADADQMRSDSQEPGFSFEIRQRDQYGFETMMKPEAPLFQEGHAQLRVSYYPEAVQEDDAPLGLQPFLQRASKVELFAMGGGNFSHVRFDKLEVDTWQRDLAVSLSADTYLKPYLAVGGSVGFGRMLEGYYLSPDFRMGKSGQNQYVPLGIGIGIRFANTRINARYQLTVADPGSGFKLVGYGQGELGVETVILRRLRIALSASGDTSGIASFLQLDLFVARRIELTLRGQYTRHFVFTNDPDVENELGMYVRGGLWIVRCFGLALDYSNSRYGSSTDQRIHRLGLEAVTRF